jgi:hypothetical protein
MVFRGQWYVQIWVIYANFRQKFAFLLTFKESYDPVFFVKLAVIGA